VGIPKLRDDDAATSRGYPLEIDSGSTAHKLIKEGHGKVSAVAIFPAVALALSLACSLKIFLVFASRSFVYSVQAAETDP